MHRQRAAGRALVLTACSAATHVAPAPRSRPARGRAGTLAPLPPFRIAQTFNTDYDHNNDGPVYGRWDARSQAIIPAPNTSDGTPNARPPRNQHTSRTPNRDHAAPGSSATKSAASN
jgi:hypothetical protein